MIPNKSDSGAAVNPDHKPRVAILGAGPAGLGAAYRLRCPRRAEVVVLEQSGVVGGNAGSFEYEGRRVDFGSHRLHPSCDEQVLEDIRKLLGTDLLDRPRHGRIWLRGRWIHFPLRPLDLLLRLDKRFAASSLVDMLLKWTRRSNSSDESYGSVLLSSLGPTICHSFYYPYARKIWGVEPTAISAVQARRRVSANSFTKLLKKLISAVPGLKQSGAGRFFYPRQGFGQISEAYAEAATALGARLMLGCRVKQLTRAGDRWLVTAERGDETVQVMADHVWSTLPIPLLAKIVLPAAPSSVQQAADEIRFRSMILAYLHLEIAQFSEYDAHYFPDEAIPITRLSEPKNYVGTRRGGSTTLCAELPCSPGDAVWNMSDWDIGEVVREALSMARLELPVPIKQVATRRLRHAYPIYEIGYDDALSRIQEWILTLPDVVTYGRQGLFAHDNTHHALFMAYSLAECLQNGELDKTMWQDCLRVFEDHVVED